MGNLKFRYSSTVGNGFLEVQTISGNDHVQVYCTKTQYNADLPGSTIQNNFRNDESYSTTTWSPIISLWDGSAYSDRVTFSTYTTIEGTIHLMGNGSTLPATQFYTFKATIDGYNHVVMRVEYAN